MSSCQCYQIGGPFIAEDPDCPRHGIEGQREAQEAEAAFARVSLLEGVVRDLLRGVVPHAVTPDDAQEAASMRRAIASARAALAG